MSDMCEILAVATPEPIAFGDVLPWATEIERLGVTGFGWGVAWRSDDGVRRYRAAVRLADDPHGRDRVAAAMADRFLVHLRRPSRLSTLDPSDAQPFLDAPDEDGVGSFAFCHNGYLERHAELKPGFGGRLRGRADSEVGFEWLRDRLGRDGEAAMALGEVHRTFGGTANLGFLGADGTLLVYGGHPANPLWLFEYRGAAVAATALHSDDDSLFDLLFTGATDRMRIGPRARAVQPAAPGAHAAG